MRKSIEKKERKRIGLCLAFCCLAGLLGMWHPEAAGAAEFSAGISAQNSEKQQKFGTEDSNEFSASFAVGEAFADNSDITDAEDNGDGTETLPSDEPVLTPTPSPTPAPQKIVVVIENPKESTTSSGSDFSDGSGQSGNDSGADTGGGSGSGDTGNGDSAGDSGAVYSYDSGGGSTQTEEIVRQPKFLLDSDSLSVKELEAGGEQTFTVSFTNRSGSQAAYNLKVTVAGDTTVTFQKNSYYISKVGAGASKTLEITLRLAENAAAGNLPLTFTFEYEDKKGTLYTSTETLSLPVAQPVKVELLTAEIPASVYSTDTLELSLAARNTGRTPIYNACITLSGTGLFPTGEVYLGNMEAGTEGSGTMRVYVGTRTMEAIGQDSVTSETEKYGTVSGTITFTYEDDQGNSYEVTQDYETEIKKPKTLSLKVEEDTEPEANSWWISIFVVVIAGLFLAVIFLLLRLHRKNVLLSEAREE